ncbi:MAG: DUF6361 family protein [Bacteroidales bacterium]
MAGIGWIHFSDTTRRQVLKIIDLLGEAGAVDELGIGVVRNAFSNEIFRGISTIQTRARYFFFVPYLLIDYLRSNQTEPVQSYMNKQEMNLLEELTLHSSNPVNDRIIGHTIAQKNSQAGRRIGELVRKPSEIYWGGIREYGIFKKTHSFHQLCNAIDKHYYSNKSVDNISTDKEKGDDNPDFEKWTELFDIPYQPGWNRKDMSLTVEEANHLSERIIETQQNNLIALLLKNPEWIEEFLAVEKYKDLIHTSFYLKLDTHNQKVLKTAVQFWELMYGAHIRFNILIQERPVQKEKVSFQENWNEWLVNTIEKFNWEEFDREFMWELTYKNSRVKYYTRQFIDSWIDKIRDKNYITAIHELDELVRNQEIKNKNDRSKLSNTNTDVHSNWVGIDQLEYRLSYAQTIVRDIAKPLEIIYA